jgi:hypothetical protein
LTGISAARAEPEIIASAVANNTIFFITIPIAFQRTSPIAYAPGADRFPAADEFC